MRAYEKTHPWISFRLNLENAPPRMWLLLGEAASKCEHIAGVPLTPDIAARLHAVYLAKGALATTAIEGNTLSEEQVVQYLDGHLRLPPSQEYLKQEISNIVSACNSLWETLQKGGAENLSAEEVMSLNAKVLRDLEIPAGVVPGEIRRDIVGVGRYRGAPPEDCQYLLETLCGWISGPGFLPRPDLGLALSIIKAVIAHLYLAWIHPFGDGNGRTARLIEFKILVASGVPTAAAHLLSNHYNHTRSRYYLELDRSSKSRTGPIDFLTYAVEGFVDQLSEQIRVVRNEQWRIAWNDYVQEQFRDKRTPSELRRLEIVLALSRSLDMKPVPRSEIPLLTPSLARSYASKTPKTITRDIRALVQRGLIRYKDGGYRAAMKKILAFLPGRRLPETPRSEPTRVK